MRKANHYLTQGFVKITISIVLYFFLLKNIPSFLNLSTPSVWTASLIPLGVLFLFGLVDLLTGAGLGGSESRPHAPQSSLTPDFSRLTTGSVIVTAEGPCLVLTGTERSKNREISYLDNRCCLHTKTKLHLSNRN